MPRRPQSLARRIVMSFVLMTLVVASLFSLTVVIAVSYTEEEYASTSLKHELDQVISEIAAGRPVQLDDDTQLFIGGTKGQPALPGWLGPVRPGFKEVYREGKEYHIVAKERADTLYVLVEDQEEYERREDILYGIVVAAFVLCILAAWGLGTLMARRVIEPVIRLAEQVRHPEQLLREAPTLATDYPPDEVGQLAAAFDTTLGQLRQVLEREQLFTSDVSHELRTPLMVIASSCDVLLEQGQADPALENRIRRMKASCEEMRELVETFLRLARASEEGRQEATKTALAQVAGEQIDRWRPEAARRGLELTLAREGEDAGCYPAPLLRAVLSNLLRNALHYTDKGFVRLVLRSGGFSVLDSGVGIPATEHETVFRPFVRGDRSRSDGLGLGLSLVQRICSQQGWAIRLIEREGGGCEFRVDFSPP